MPPKRTAASQSPDMQQHMSGDGSPPGNPDEFTRVVRKRLSTSSRTGQACDRCKVRKIRCDGLPGGCSPCMQNHTECKTTDRISQKAVPRGHLENLEKRCNDLEAKNKELQAQMATMELDRNNGGYMQYQNTEWDPNAAKMARPTFNDRWRGDRSNSNISPYILNGGTPISGPIKGSSFRPGNLGTHYLGMSSGNSYLSSMKDKALKLLGIEIDLSLLDPSEPNNRGDATQPDGDDTTTLSTMFNVTGTSVASLPEKDEGLRLIEYYFMISHPYLPILHKPSFMKFVDRVYSDSTFTPSAAQTVQLHMVFAIVHYQTGAIDRMKNHGQIVSTTSQLYARSRLHYHYAVSLTYHLVNSSTLEDVQAIGLILQHKRAFPKPGNSWLMARMAIAMSLDLGLHRSPNKFSAECGLPAPNPVEAEVRKRVFWCILTLETSLASKLGRPMSLREGDFDVEFPEALEDDMITETGLLKRADSNDECTIDIAIELFRHTVLSIQMHSALYAAVRPSRDEYVAVVEELEGKLVKWHQNCTKNISLNSPKPERRFQAAHLESWFHEARILMRHPSISLSPSPSFTNDCVRICVESSRAILHLTDELRKGNHYLDTTWYGATLQLIATSTILFSLWDKRDTVTPEEILAVRKEMDLCMDIMGDLGSLLGSPNRLREVVQVLTQRTMDLLDSKHDKPPPSKSTTRVSPPTAAFPSYPASSTNPSIPSMRVSSSTPPINPPFIHPPQSLNTYPPAPTQTDQEFYDSAAANTPTTFPPAYPDAPSSYPPNWGWSGSESWRQYIQNITTNSGELDPSETYSATALIALNQDCNNGFMPNGNAAVLAQNVAAAAAAVQQVQQQEQQQEQQQQQQNGFVQQQAEGSPPWPIAISAFQYTNEVREEQGGAEGQ